MKHPSIQGINYQSRFTVAIYCAHLSGLDNAINIHELVRSKNNNNWNAYMYLYTRNRHT